MKLPTYYLNVIKIRFQDPKMREKGKFCPLTRRVREASAYDKPPKKLRRQEIRTSEQFVSGRAPAMMLSEEDA